jgi:RNA polymerase sigma factor (sigma-70 family)
MTMVTGGGDTGFDEAFWPLSNLAYRTAYRALGLAAPAEDVAAETMARASSHWSRLEHPIDAWVVTVAARLAVDHQRKAWRSVPMSGDVEQVARDLEGHLDLVRSLRALPRRQREVITLRYLVDLSEVEVGRILGCSVSTVQTQARRGLAELRGLLDTAKPADESEAHS